MTKFDFKAAKKSYANGAILRIKLENFVTYDSLEFSPGANLNVIIGPNGTGKSSIVCAICLGMAGKPSVLGRASNLSDYIKYGKNYALIEIELNNQSGQNYAIRRVIYKDNKSEWFLNERSAKLKEIEDLISSLNIQVGNLCQFLPQEKVAEFARLNTFELLENTEKAVGGIELYEKHMELKDNSKATKDLERELAAVQESLKKEETINARLENQVKSYLERKKNEDKVIWLKRKRACLVYKEKKQEWDNAENEAKTLDAQLKDFKKQKEPLEKKKSEIDQKLVKIKNISTTKNNELQECLQTTKTINSRLEEQSEKSAEIKSEYQGKENEIKQRLNENNELKKTIEQLKRQIEDEDLNITDIQAEEGRTRAKETELRRESTGISNKEYEIKSDIVKLKAELENLSRLKSEINNVRTDKLNKLKQGRSTQDVYAAIEWLNKNRHNFKGQAYEPMFLNINIKMPNVAKFVENNISFRDLTSMFLFEKSEDMNYFQIEVRQKLKLAVNSALIPKESLSSFVPPIPIEDIKKYGFKSYLREIIDAPEAILTYLCLYFKIHAVPIGDENTQRNIGSVLQAIPEFSRLYTNTHQYSILRSRYTNKISSSSNEVGESYWLTLSVDNERLNSLESREKEINAQIASLEQTCRRFIEDKNNIEKQIELVRAEIKKINERKLYVANLIKKLEVKQTRLQRNESEKIDLVADAKKKAQQYQEVSKKRAKLINDIVDVTNRLISLNKDKLFANYQEAQMTNEKRRIDSDLRQLISKNSELTEQKEHIDGQVKLLKDEAKALLGEASKLNEVNLLKGEQMPNAHKAKFEQLPDTIELLDSEIHQCEAIAQCSSDVDERLVDDFNNRKKLIESLQSQYDKKRGKLENHQQNYEDLKNEWIDKVEEMISQINEKFSALFKQLKCAGEISLARPDNPDEFAKYGIKIRVSFRSNEQLQELTAWQQSGGEKSVSTMMYMIALQEMTKCPFRVVDEINQGMDPVNERKVFDIIVQNSCSKQFAQYFLLTPKLLPDLAFDEKTNVICVFNGPFNIQHSKYDLKKFIEIRKKQNAA